MQKSGLFLLLTLCLTIAIGGCGNSNDDTDVKADSTMTSAAEERNDDIFLALTTTIAIEKFYYNAAKAVGKTDREAQMYSEVRSDEEITGEVSYDVEVEVMLESINMATTAKKGDLEELLKAYSNTYQTAYANAKDAGMSEADAFVTASATYSANNAFPIAITYHLAKCADNAAKNIKEHGEKQKIYLNTETAIKEARKAFVKIYTQIYFKAYADTKVAGKNADDAHVAAKLAGETYTIARAIGETVTKELDNIEFEVFASTADEVRASGKNDADVVATANAEAKSTREAFDNAFAVIYFSAYGEAKAIGQDDSEASIYATKATQMAIATLLRDIKDATANAMADINADGKISDEEFFDAIIAADQAATKIVIGDFLETYSLL